MAIYQRGCDKHFTSSPLSIVMMMLMMTFLIIRKDARLPVQLQRAMAAEAEAAREARAKVIINMIILMVVINMVILMVMVEVRAKVVKSLINDNDNGD